MMGKFKHAIKTLITKIPFGLKYLILAKLLVLNILAKFKSEKHTDWVCAIKDFDPEGRMKYSWDVFQDYFKYSGISPEDLKGKTILEVGPGENFCVALMLLAYGAEKVVCVDRFPSLLPAAQQALVYTELEKKLQTINKTSKPFLEIIGSEFKIDSSKLRYLPNIALEEIKPVLYGEKFDLILSRAVLEHVYDLDQSFSAMDEVIKPGGALIHEVDFRDHAIFTSYGMNPLTFLTFTDFAWNLATNRLGAPNRRIIDSYREILGKRGYDYNILKILAVGSDSKFHEENLTVGKTHGQEQVNVVESIRSSLNRKFQKLSNDDLLTSGIFMVAKKRA